MQLHCVEIDHESAVLEIREKIAQQFSDIPSLLGKLGENNIEETFILSTCNRFAIYFVAEHIRKIYSIVPALEPFAGYIREYNSSLTSIRNFLETSAGIKSQLTGEYEILGQIKKYYQIALNERSIGQNLDIIIREGLSLGRQVRSSTKVSDHTTSYAALAYNLIVQKFKDTSDLSILLIGTGKMSELMSNLLNPINFKQILIASHHFDRAVNFARERNYVPLDLNDLEALPVVDVIIAGTHREIDFPFDKFQAGCPRDRFTPDFQTTLIIDLGVPRNFNSKALNGINVDYTDLDALIKSKSQNIALRRQEIPRVKEIIEEKLEFIIRLFCERRWDPVYKAYWNKLRSIQDKELKWLLPKLGDIDENQLLLIRKFSQKLIRQISSDPFRHMRQAAHDSNQPSLTFDLIKNLYDFNELGSCKLLDIKND